MKAFTATLLLLLLALLLDKMVRNRSENVLNSEPGDLVCRRWYAKMKSFENVQKEED